MQDWRTLLWTLKLHYYVQCWCGFLCLPTLASHNSVMMANFVGGLFLCLLYCVTLNSRCSKKMLCRENYLLSAAQPSRLSKDLQKIPTWLSYNIDKIAHRGGANLWTEKMTSHCEALQEDFQVCKIVVLHHSFLAQTLEFWVGKLMEVIALWVRVCVVMIPLISLPLSSNIRRDLCANRTRNFCLSELWKSRHTFASCFFPLYHSVDKH